MSDAPRRSPLMWIVIIFAAAVGATIAQTMVRQASGQGSSKSVFPVLSQASDEINRRAPYRVDEVTVLRRTEVRGRTLVYHFEIAEGVVMNQMEYEQRMEPRVSERVCAEQGLRPVIRAGGEVRYLYENSRGVQIDYTVRACPF